MSQQKVFFALVVVAGCVALAAGQNMDMNACISGAQQEICKFVQPAKCACIGAKI